ncbi:nostrin-like isoform X4 [Tubulanus polymorphus]|uniref:nostrin-like isoform X4 n=1 Tax=Tubulanus polymorphus TaxID=672921 RepID=UPI003DA2AA28
MYQTLRRRSSLGGKFEYSGRRNNKEEWDDDDKYKATCGLEMLKGLNGFDELRRYIKSGNEFCKEVSAIMQDRSEIELNYAKNLSRLSSKLQKLAATCIGTMAGAWVAVATEMEAEAELHRTLCSALLEDINKPLKTLTEHVHKSRKPIEAAVDKSIKNLLEKRNEEGKCKKNAFTLARDSEKIMDQLTDAKAGKGRFGEKDISKLEKKSKQLESGARKADKEYHDHCLKAEAARQEWEGSVYKGCTQLQSLEEERLSQLHEVLNKYSNHLSVIGPKRIKSVERMEESIMIVDMSADLQAVVEQKGTGQNQPEQLLFECYAEDLNNTMNRERRLHWLRNALYFLEQDMDIEKKGREGVEKLMEVYRNRPNFADNESQDDAKRKLLSTRNAAASQVNAMMNYLEASHYKLSCAQAAVHGQSKPTHRFSEYIEHSKDKQGLPQSVLRLPLSMINNDMSDYGYMSQGDRPQPAGGQSSGQSDCSDNPYDDVDSIRSLDELKTYTCNANSTNKCNGNDRLGSYTESVDGSQWSLKESMKSHDGDDLDDDLDKQGMSLSIFGDNDFAEVYDYVGQQAAASAAAYSSNTTTEYKDYGNDIIGECTALYDYAATQSDELSLRQGDVIQIIHKHEDGWWYGEKPDKSRGMIPATYVTEVNNTNS